MKITPLPPYFLVRLPKKKIDKVGSIIIPETCKFMAFNLQQGDIVAIGSGAAEYFPEAKIGHTILIHHFVEGMDDTDARVDHLIDSDEDYNYYVVTAFEFNGKTSETYGIWDGEKIIPNKDYIFLRKTVKKQSDIDFEKLNKEKDYIPTGMSISGSGLMVFEEWEESRELMELKQAMIKKEVEDLSKSGNNKRHIQNGILEKEKEMSDISININKKKFIPFKVAYYNTDFLSSSVLYSAKSYTEKTTIEPSDNVYVMNIAAQTEIEFNNKTYIVARTKYAVMIV